MLVAFRSPQPTSEVYTMTPKEFNEKMNELTQAGLASEDKTVRNFATIMLLANAVSAFGPNFFEAFVAEYVEKVEKLSKVSESMLSTLKEICSENSE